MKLIGTTDDLLLKPRGKVSVGDIVIRLWKNHCRRANRKDRYFFYVATAKQGKLFRIHLISPNDVYSAKVKYPKKPIYVSKGMS